MKAWRFSHRSTEMTADARRFTATLCIVFGPLFILGGFLAAFTVEGALFVFLGMGMIASGVLLRTRLPLFLAVAAGVLVFVALTVQMIFELRG
jgi:hypothetical protein